MTATTTGPIRLWMPMSLDGFIAGPDDRTGQELGPNGGRLFNWLDDGDVPLGGVTFCTDVEACAADARATAGARAVLAHGAGAAQALLRAGYRVRSP